jgi:hypothetical protein
LLTPEQMVAPYERTLNRMPKLERTRWAERVQGELLEVVPVGAEIIVLAGERYRADLIPFLRAHGFAIFIPVEGLSFGRQLSALKDEAAQRHDHG